jgi:vacuolar-type H+-ATPase subunit H
VPAEKITSSVESIEIEAEKLLKEARSKAAKILRKGDEDASKILSAKVSLDEVWVECEQIINKAKKEADKELKESKRKAAGIKASASKKVGGITKRIAGIISGQS